MRKRKALLANYYSISTVAADDCLRIVSATTYRKQLPSGFQRYYRDVVLRVLSNPDEPGRHVLVMEVTVLH
jgi:hypothetical protein